MRTAIIHLLLIVLMLAILISHEVPAFTRQVVIVFVTLAFINGIFYEGRNKKEEEQSL